MPEGHAERGVEATRAHAMRARHAESMDGAEHRASIEPMMAGPHAGERRRLSDGVVLLFSLQTL
jgi:hypothetical protein